ncbi:MAG: hypothetical protein ACYCUW_01665 [bacterium]
MSDLNFIVGLVALILTVAGSVMVLMSHIDGKIDTKIKEVKDDIQSTVNRQFNTTNAKIDLFFNKIANENAELRGYVFKPAEDKKPC